MEPSEYLKAMTAADAQEIEEWRQSLQAVLLREGPQRAQALIKNLIEYSQRHGVLVPGQLQTPYLNTLSIAEQPPYPGDPKIEWRIRSWVRWNAMAMVVKANQVSNGIGGHISTFASAATLLEVAFNHYLKGKNAPGGGDQVYFQGHSAPGIYARAFLEGRLNLEQITHFRRELAKGGGLSSYPHPYLMPDFWEFPTVSMGLSPLMAIYQARFNRYLNARGIRDTRENHVWAFMGDGETDEPEALGSLSIAAREKLDNLTFVINCNLQRLDGPVRGNGKIIQELESVFLGAGWNVIKVIWGGDWDPLLAADNGGLLVERMERALDGDYQKYSVEPGAYTRQHFFGTSPQLLQLVEHLSDEKIQKLRRGGHDPDKVNAAYSAALRHRGGPTVILAKTIKGYGLGEAGEGRNMSHAQKKLNFQELKIFRDRYEIPIPDAKLEELPFFKPDLKSPEMEYLLERRRQLGGFLPHRRVLPKSLQVPPLKHFQEVLDGSGDREIATTMAFHRVLTLLLKEEIGKRIVPIIPDEARTFGMDPLFRSIGIYSSLGQRYEPVDKNHFLYYRESTQGQLLEEGITEAGSMASLIAAGTSYATHGEPMIPFYIYYSMFGFQRTGDLMWAFGDMRGRGFLIGATAGRSTLAGEGLQHQDGHSHVLMSVIPNVRAYHPAWAFEIAVIVQEGLKRMLEEGEDVFYYLTVQNEPYPQAPMPAGAETGILQGMYLFKMSEAPQQLHVQLLGSSAILREVLRAQNILMEIYGISSHVWSVTSYQLLRKEALSVEHWNRNHPREERRQSYLEKLLEGHKGPFIAASDSIKSMADQISRWIPGRWCSLGTDGFGLSENRKNLRRFFEIDAESIVVAALDQLFLEGKMPASTIEEALNRFNFRGEREYPFLENEKA